MRTCCRKAIHRLLAEPRRSAPAQPQCVVMPARDIPDELRNRPFAITEARARGMSRRMLRGTRFRAVARGVYATTAVPESYATLVRATLLTLPTPTIATGATGLRLYGVLVGAELPLRLVTTHPRQIRRRGVRVTRVSRLPQQRDRIAVPEHCWMVAAGHLDLLELVTAGDWLLRLRRSTLAKLEAYVRGNSSWGCRSARAAVELVRERVDSPRETWLRLCLVLAGLPTPECNVVIGDDSGPIGRVDLVYVAFKIIIEYEGDQHRTDRGQWNRDIDRQEDFARDRWTLIRVTSERLRWPRQVVRSVFDALRTAGYEGPEPTFDEAWSNLFERPDRSPRRPASP